jgi:hypothetical protein
LYLKEIENDQLKSLLHEHAVEHAGQVKVLPENADSGLVLPACCAPIKSVGATEAPIIVLVAGKVHEVLAFRPELALAG